MPQACPAGILGAQWSAQVPRADALAKYKDYLLVRRLRSAGNKDTQAMILIYKGKPFRPITDAPGYFCAADGALLSVRRTKKPRLLNPMVSKAGYRVLRFYSGTNESGRLNYVHAVIATTWIRPRIPGECCNHKNGTKTDNRVENLEWVTPRENVLHRMNVLGKNNRGSNHGLSKLKEAQVLEIRGAIKMGRRVSDVAAHYGMHQSTISYIKSGKLWGWLGGV